MGVHLDDGHHGIGRRLLVLVFVGADAAAAIPGEAEVLARFRGAVDLARRNVVAHPVHLIVGEPDVAGLGVDVHADRVADAAGEDLAPGAVGLHPHDAADAPLVVELALLGRGHVEGLAERNVDHAVRADVADAGGVVEALLLDRDQLALLHEVEGRHIARFIEELGRGKEKHAVLLGDIEEAVLREAGAVRDGEAQRGGEILHLIGHAVLVAVGDGPDLVLAGAHEGHDALRPHSHVARIGDHGIEADAEALRQLDPLEIALDAVGEVSALLDEGEVGGAGALEIRQFLEIVRHIRRLRMGQSRGQGKGREGRHQSLHVFLPC